jgi:hypothetical protein
MVARRRVFACAFLESSQNPGASVAFERASSSAFSLGTSKKPP